MNLTEDQFATLYSLEGPCLPVQAPPIPSAGAVRVGSGWNSPENLGPAADSMGPRHRSPCEAEHGWPGFGCIRRRLLTIDYIHAPDVDCIFLSCRYLDMLVPGARKSKHRSTPCIATYLLCTYAKCLLFTPSALRQPESSRDILRFWARPIEAVGSLSRSRLGNRLVHPRNSSCRTT